MSLADELMKLQQLRECGAITEHEFTAAKAKLLNHAPLSWSFWTSPPDSGSDIEQRTRTWAFLLHLSLLLGYLVPVFGSITAILIWQLLKDRLPGLDEHGKNAANALISFVIYMAISGALCLVGIGFAMLAVFSLCGIVFPLYVAIKAKEGEVRKYPLAIPFFT